MAYMSKFKTKNQGNVPIGSNLFGTCSTAAGTSAKVVTLSDFNVLTEGVTVHVYCANANSLASSTLKVGSTDAKPISGGKWSAGQVVSFTYHNGSWVQNDYQDGETYTLSLSDHTLKLVDSNGTESTVTLPNDGKTYGLSFNNGVLQLVEGGGSSSVTIPDTNTTYTISISGHTITLTPSSGMAQSVTVPDDDTTYTISISGQVLTLTPSDGTPQSVTLPSSSLKYTKDAPDSANSTNNVVQNDVNGNVATGGYSIAEGTGTEASGYGSHAEGIGTVASGQHSHAEGFDTGASNSSSHAEGDSTLATGSYSHSEGVGTIASGSHSHAGGQGTEARGRAQTAIGEYNVVDTQNKYLFIIGNGTYPSPSNAFDVSWGGDVRMALATTEDLYTAINAHGWASSPIIV